jgi:hypothetical protein
MSELIAKCAGPACAAVSGINNTQAIETKAKERERLINGSWRATAMRII